MRGSGRGSARQEKAEYNGLTGSLCGYRWGEYKGKTWAKVEIVRKNFKLD